MLKQRVITSLILTPLVIWAIFSLPDIGFVVMLGVFVALAGWEWALLIGLRSLVARVIFSVFISACWLIAIFYFKPQLEQLVFILWGLLIWWLIRTVQIYRYKGTEKSQDYFHPGRALNGLVVIAAPFYLVHVLRSEFAEPGLLLYVLFTIWGADTFAYFAGRKWGKTKLAPRVSPGKSWQGVYGALICGAILSVIGAVIYKLDLLSALMLLLLTLVIVVFSIIGDLSESLYKRELKIKDSGQLLPGHGGILDRVDSFTAAIPVFMLGIYYMGMLT